MPFPEKYGCETEHFVPGDRIRRGEGEEKLSSASCAHHHSSFSPLRCPVQTKLPLGPHSHENLPQNCSELVQCEQGLWGPSFRLTAGYNIVLLWLCVLGLGLLLVKMYLVSSKHPSCGCSPSCAAEVPAGQCAAASSPYATFPHSSISSCTSWSFPPSWLWGWVGTLREQRHPAC